MKHTPTCLLLLALAVAMALFVGCAGERRLAPLQESDYAPPPGEGDRPIYLGTQEMQQRVAALLRRVPEANDAERGVLGLQLVRLGEPAVAPLMEALRDGRPSIRATAAFALGQLRDARAMPALVALLDDDLPNVRYEAATALLRQGDRRGLARMVAGLEDEDPLWRQRSLQVLEETTGETFGFVANDTLEDRSAAVSRWRAWLYRVTGGGR